MLQLLLSKLCNEFYVKFVPVHAKKVYVGEEFKLHKIEVSNQL